MWWLGNVTFSWYLLFSMCYSQVAVNFRVNCSFFTFILRKINKNWCQQSCSCGRQYASNGLSAGASPQTPLESLERSPRPLAVFKGPTCKARGGVKREWRVLQKFSHKQVCIVTGLRHRSVVFVWKELVGVVLSRPLWHSVPLQAWKSITTLV